jgi:PAS domain-containing protein
VEALIDKQNRGWRGFCEVAVDAVADTEIAGCQAIMAEQSVDQLLEALHANNEALQSAKDAEESARTRLSLLLGAVPVVVYSFGARGDFAPTFVSDSIQAILGYRPEEYMQHADFWRSRVHPDDLTRVESEQAQLFEKGHHSAEYRFHKKRMVPIAG